MNRKISDLINIIYSAKGQLAKEKILESYINREKQDSYFQAKLRATKKQL